MVTLHLNLKRHCIETAIKRTYNRALAAYFKPEGDRKRLEAQITLAKTALKQFDFGHLRSTYHALRGGRAAVVTLGWDDNGAVFLMLDEQRIRPGHQG
jgi:hypothetical protein